MAANLLADKTWGVGYYVAGGNINQQENHRYAEEYIEVNPNHHYAIIMGNLSGQNWVGYCTYDQNKNYLNRIGTTFNGNIMIVKFNCNYVLFSYKLTNVADTGIGLYDLDDMGIELEEVS